MAFATSKIIACVCAFCAAEMAGELFRKLSENLPIEGACPRLWCRAVKVRAVVLIFPKRKTPDHLSMIGGSYLPTWWS